jgi:hypothetical protein
LIQLYRWFPSILQVLTIIRPETLVRWHRASFRCYWRWKSRPLGGNGGAAVGEDVGESALKCQLIGTTGEPSAPAADDAETRVPNFQKTLFAAVFVPSAAHAFGTTDYDFLCLGMELA